jgi:hypothetical protein
LNVPLPEAISRLIPSPLSICLVDSAAIVFISSALGLVALIADGE